MLKMIIGKKIIFQMINKKKIIQIVIRNKKNPKYNKPILKLKKISD